MVERAFAVKIQLQEPTHRLNNIIRKSIEEEYCEEVFIWPSFHYFKATSDLSLLFMLLDRFQSKRTTEAFIQAC
jgi:hypothetical protein